MVSPSRFANVGRFLNTSDSNNCLPLIGIFQYDKDGLKNEICVIIYTTKAVKSGEELKYPYGDYYPLRGKQIETDFDK